MPEMQFYCAMKNFLFTLLFIPGEMKCNFISGVVGVKRPIKKCNPERDIKRSMLETTMQTVIDQVLEAEIPIIQKAIH